MLKVVISFIFLYSCVFAQELRISFNTGDTDIDQYLNEVNTYAKVEYDFFKKDLSMKFGITPRNIDQYVYKENINPADLYYACVISNVTKRKVGDVIAIYKDKKGWGAVAMEIGIKPGSKEFHRLKGKSISGIGKVKSRNMNNGRKKSPGKK